MGIFQTIEGLEDDLAGLIHRQRPATLFHQLLDTAAVTVLQHEKERTAGIAMIDQADDVPVLQGHGIANLALEHRHRLGIGSFFAGSGGPEPG
jgi:hypothetical protein